jgi:hypothetical protein
MRTVQMLQSFSAGRQPKGDRINIIARQSTVQVARELFHRTWHIATRSIVRNGPESVSWAIYADLKGDGQIPRALVAGGVCNNEPEAHEAMRKKYELWTVTGMAELEPVTRAGW